MVVSVQITKHGLRRKGLITKPLLPEGLFYFNKGEERLTGYPFEAMVLLSFYVLVSLLGK